MTERKWCVFPYRIATAEPYRWVLAGLVAMTLLVAGHVAADEAGQATVTVTSKEVPRLLVLDGVLEAVDQGTVSAQTSGRILAIHFDVNDLVPAGAVLLEITSREQTAGLSAARAALAEAQAVNADAQAQLSRLQRLFGTGAVSQRDLDAARARAKATASVVEQAQAGIVRAREALGYTEVRAPYSGIVSRRHVEVGEAVNPGQPLMSGFAIDRMRAVIDIPQRFASRIDAATHFTVTLPDGEQIGSDDVTLFQYADQRSHSFRARINLPVQQQPKWVPGMWVKVAFPYASRNQLLIPADAVLSQSELSAVYIQTDEGFQLRQVRLGQRQGGQVEVLAGLNPGEIIAADAWQVVAGQGGSYAN